MFWSNPRVLFSSEFLGKFGLHHNLISYVAVDGSEIRRSLTSWCGKYMSISHYLYGGAHIHVKGGWPWDFWTIKQYVISKVVVAFFSCSPRKNWGSEAAPKISSTFFFTADIFCNCRVEQWTKPPNNWNLLFIFFEIAYWISENPWNYRCSPEIIDVAGDVGVFQESISDQEVCGLIHFLVMPFASKCYTWWSAVVQLVGEPLTLGTFKLASTSQLFSNSLVSPKSSLLKLACCGESGPLGPSPEVQRSNWRNSNWGNRCIMSWLRLLHSTRKKKSHHFFWTPKKNRGGFGNSGWWFFSGFFWKTASFFKFQKWWDCGSV